MDKQPTFEQGSAVNIRARQRDGERASNPENERIKHRFFLHLKEAQGYSEQTIDGFAKALARFEEDTKHRNFMQFRNEQATAFKRRLAEQRSERTRGKLSLATQHTTLNNLRRFFIWLADQPAYKSRILRTDADYFRLSEKETRIATTGRESRAPSIEQVKHVITSMPNDSDVQRRDRAVIALALLTGARDNALASFAMKDVNLAERCVYQDARHVRTKFSKSFPTWFFPVGEEVLAAFAEWVTYLRDVKHWGPDDPLFPATRNGLGVTGHFEAIGLERRQWQSAAPIRAIFRRAFAAADLPYYNPHSLRKTLARLATTMCNKAEDFKAWSQNLGHEDVMTTFRSYGAVPAARQEEIMRGYAMDRAVSPKQAQAEELAEAVARKLSAQFRGKDPTEEESSS
jgi:site-specific recombinase XerD